jgi:dihydrodipicolinate synthase/N-acetylneuraminate lyase
MDTHETSSKSQTPSSKSQGSFKIQYSKGEAAFGARRGGDVDNDGSFDVFVGSESFLLANMRYGGVGTISATANVNPAAIHELYTEWKNQDADEQQAKLNVVRQVFSSRKFPSMIATLKQAIAIYAEDPAWAKVRPPLVELTPEQANTLSEELKAIGFEMELKRKKEEGRIKEK